jgi:hypothetical protein
MPDVNPEPLAPTASTGGGPPVPGDPWARYLAAHLEEALAQQSGEDIQVEGGSARP